MWYVMWLSHCIVVPPTFVTQHCRYCSLHNLVWSLYRVWDCSWPRLSLSVSPSSSTYWRYCVEWLCNNHQVRRLKISCLMHNFTIIEEKWGREEERGRKLCLHLHTHACCLVNNCKNLICRIWKNWQIAKFLSTKYSMYDVCMFLVSLMDWRGNTWSVLAGN